MKKYIILAFMASVVLISCKDKVTTQKVTETTVSGEFDETPPLPQDRLDSLVYDVVTKLQHFADTNEHFKGIKVESYAALKDIRYITGVYEIFARYDSENVWDEIEHYSAVYDFSIAKEDYNVADTSWSSDDMGDYMHVNKNAIRKGEIVVRDGGDVLFHTKSLKEAQSQLYEALVDAVYGPSHQPPHPMKLTGYSAYPKGKIF